MKKKIICTIIILILLSIGGYFILKNSFSKPINQDAQRFAKEYEQVTEDNVFVYKNVDDIIDIMNHGTGIVYLGYPECPWCQYYVKYLNEVAKEVGIEKIYYCNTKELKENNMDKFNELITILDENLQYNDEGKRWIYVPNVSFHINGKIIANDYETSKDTHNLKDPKQYWTNNEIKELKNKLKIYMNKVLAATNICTDCNK